MNHIIDGHNLISKVPGLSLDMPDDEEHLVELLMRFSQVGGHRVEVFFDGAPPGQAGVRNFSRVRARFVPASHTADDAIRKRLASLGNAAKNWLVVSSDRAVQAAAREAHAQVLASEEFAPRLRAAQQPGADDARPSPDAPLTESEVKEWEEFFKRRRKNF